MINKKISMIKVCDLSEGELVAITICILLGFPMVESESKLHAASLRQRLRLVKHLMF